MCHPATCSRNCAQDLHAATTPEARAKAACVCDSLAPELCALVEAGVPQREASLRLWGAA